VHKENAVMQEEENQWHIQDWGGKEGAQENAQENQRWWKSQRPNQLHTKTIIYEVSCLEKRHQFKANERLLKLMRNRTEQAQIHGKNTGSRGFMKVFHYLKTVWKVKIHK
jgi:hypothetical protein